MTVIYCHLHVCSALKAAIGQLCQTFYDDQNVKDGIIEWNFLQTILKQRCRSMDGCLCILSSLLLAQFLFTAAWVLQRHDQLQLVYSNIKCFAFWVGWTVPSWALILYAAFQAATVTAQCARVPSLINSWLGEEDTLLIVDYIVNSTGSALHALHGDEDHLHCCSSRFHCHYQVSAASLNTLVVSQHEFQWLLMAAVMRW